LHKKITRRDERVRERSDTCVMYHSDANANAGANDANNYVDGNGNGCCPGSTTDNKESRSLLSKNLCNKNCTRKKILFDDAANNDDGDGGDMAFGGDAAVSWAVMVFKFPGCT
jgi:hypothetical protein